MKRISILFALMLCSCGGGGGGGFTDFTGIWTGRMVITTDSPNPNCFQLNDTFDVRYLVNQNETEVVLNDIAGDSWRGFLTEDGTAFAVFRDFSTAENGERCQYLLGIAFGDLEGDVVNAAVSADITCIYPPSTFTAPTRCEATGGGRLTRIGQRQ